MILDSPVAPVMEGDNVTLRCAHRPTSSDRLSTSFYKNDFLLRDSPTGNVTFHHVSRSDQGSYKCSIPDVGESEQSWLTVTGETHLCNLTFIPSTLRTGHGSCDHALIFPATLEDPPSIPLLYLLLIVTVSVAVFALLLLLAVQQHQSSKTSITGE